MPVEGNGRSDLRFSSALAASIIYWRFFIYSSWLLVITGAM